MLRKKWRITVCHRSLYFGVLELASIILKQILPAGGPTKNSNKMSDEQIF